MFTDILQKFIKNNFVAKIQVLLSELRCRPFINQCYWLIASYKTG